MRRALATVIAVVAIVLGVIAGNALFTMLATG